MPRILQKTVHEILCVLSNKWCYFHKFNVIGCNLFRNNVNNLLHGSFAAMWQFFNNMKKRIDLVKRIGMNRAQELLPGVSLWPVNMVQEMLRPVLTSARQYVAIVDISMNMVEDESGGWYIN